MVKQLHTKQTLLIALDYMSRSLSKLVENFSNGLYYIKCKDGKHFL